MTTEDQTPEEPKTNQLVRRGFEGVTLAHEGPATQALIAKETATIQARWIMAMRCPRNIDNVRQVLLKECERVGFAEKAIYSVPRGDKPIRGLTIRFAEVAMRCMGNMSAEAVTIFDTDEERLVRVTVTDYETNSTWQRDITIKKTVERKFLKKGQQPIRSRTNNWGDQVHLIEATDDDVVTKEGSAISKAARTAILRLIPGDLQDEMFRKCDTLMADKARKDPDGEKKKVFDAFATLNIMPTQIAEWLGHPIEQTTPAELVELQKLYRGLREGEIDWRDAMNSAEETRERTKAAAKAKAPKSDPPKTETSSTAAPATATPATKTEPPKEQPKTEQKAATSTGKGTAAVKDKIKTAEAPAAPRPDTAPAPTDPNVEERACSMCGVPVECTKDTANGTQRCYACSQS
jgi:hypothetical protein